MEPVRKRPLIAAAGFAFVAACGLANAASWSVIVPPGVYGRVAIGGYAEPPRVYTPQPVMAVADGYGQVVEEVVDPAYATDQPPVYLWVPEYQRLHWAEYCREYGAYGVPVYFVDDGWYRANVLRRNWTPEQRSWTEQQWLEQDRLARDRLERQRFEQQRYEQRLRWNSEHARRQQPPLQAPRPVEDMRSRQAGSDRERADQQDAQARARAGAAGGQASPQALAGARSQSGVGSQQTGAASQPRGAGRDVERGDRRATFDRGRGREGGGGGGGRDR
jgi:hypothetical protein